MSPPILLIDDRPADYQASLEARFPDQRFETCQTPEAVPQRLAEIAPEIVFSVKCPGLPGPAHRPVLDCPTLRWVQVGGAGVDHLPAWDPARVRVTNAAGVLSPFMAEYVIGAILMTNFGFPTYWHQQRESRWQQQDWTAAAGKTLLIVGLGRIGEQTARLAKAVGLRVLAVRRKAEAPEAVDELLPPERLHEGLVAADFVVLHVPLTETTRYLIDAEALACMKPSALLINCARGPVVDEAALLATLDEGRLAGAVLDVFAEEPLPPDSPLWSQERVIITPHVSDSVADWRRRFADFFAENLERWTAGQPLLNELDPIRGY